MRTVSTLTAAFFFSFALFAQTPLRVVLVEEGTGTGCQWCPRGDVYGQNALDAFPGQVAYVATHGFNADDPMYFEVHNEILLDLGLSGYPSGIVNRGNVLSMNNAWGASSDLDTYVNQAPDLNVLVEVTYAEGELTVNLTADVFNALNGDFCFGAIVIEDGVTGPSPQYDQSNAYSGGDEGPMGGFEDLPSPVPASIHVYNHVSRALLGGPTADEVAFRRKTHRAYDAFWSA